MIHTKDQNGKIIIAVGAEGSHVRNKDEFNITLPKLIDLLDKNWCRGGLDRHTEPQDLFDIMQDDGVPKEKQSSLYNSAYYYFDVTRGIAPYNENVALRKADVMLSLPLTEMLDEVSAIYKLINFTDVEEPYRENVRQAKRKLNKIAGTLNKIQRGNGA